jgi:hypothetical protein
LRPFAAKQEHRRIATGANALHSTFPRWLADWAPALTPVAIAASATVRGWLKLSNPFPFSLERERVRGAFFEDVAAKAERFALHV